MSPFSFEHVLVPIDGSEGAMKALDCALSLCERLGGKLTVLAVEGKLPAYAASVGEVEEVKREKDAFFSAVLERALEKAAARGVVLETDLVPGHAAEVITHYARAHGHDLIVIGHRGHFLGDYLLGSTADRVAITPSARSWWSGEASACTQGEPPPLRGRDLRPRRGPARGIPGGRPRFSERYSAWSRPPRESGCSPPSSWRSTATRSTISAPRGGIAVSELTCIIEIPKGSRNKYEWDKELGAIKLDRLLFSSIVYPMEYGYIPDTCARDGDPLDVLVCVSEPTFPGCVIESKPIAVFRMADEKGPDEKILCVPETDPSWSSLETLEDLSQSLRDEIQHFFSVYKDLEQKSVEVEGWGSREEALEVIEDARRRFSEQ